MDRDNDVDERRLAEEESRRDLADPSLTIREEVLAILAAKLGNRWIRENNHFELADQILSLIRNMLELEYSDKRTEGKNNLVKSKIKEALL